MGFRNVSPWPLMLATLLGVAATAGAEVECEGSRECDAIKALEEARDIVDKDWRQAEKAALRAQGILPFDNRSLRYTKQCLTRTGTGAYSGITYTQCEATYRYTPGSFIEDLRRRHPPDPVVSIAVVAADGGWGSSTGGEAVIRIRNQGQTSLTDFSVSGLTFQGRSLRSWEVEEIAAGETATVPLGVFRAGRGMAIAASFAERYGFVPAPITLSVDAF